MDKFAMHIKAIQNPKLAAVLKGSMLPIHPGECLCWSLDPIAQQARISIWAALEELDTRSRDVIIARFGAGVTLTEYATTAGISRERVRQIEAKGLRTLRALLRDDMDLISAATRVEPLAGGPLDPDWVNTEEAARLTSLTKDHLCHLARTGRIRAHRNPYNRSAWLILKQYLKYYVSQKPTRGRKRGLWKGDPNEATSL